MSAANSSRPEPHDALIVEGGNALTDSQRADSSIKSEGSTESKGERSEAPMPYIPPLAPDDDCEPHSVSSLFSRHRAANLDGIATRRSVFDDPSFASAYTPHPQWEGNSRLDPLCRWTYREERSLIRKLDWRILALAFVMFFAMDLDRENIAQANSDGMLRDLGLSTADYNLGQTLFRVGFLLAELPSQMVAKRVGVDRWVPIQLIAWSAFSIAQFSMRSRASFLTYRTLIGIFSGGFIPDMVLWLSYFYTSREMPARLTIFWLSNYLVKILGPFAALGLLKLRGYGGYAGWRYLYAVEGLFTLLVGVFALFHMPAGPTQSRNWLYPRGWFSERQETIMVNRVLRDDPTKGDMHNRQGIDWPAFKRCLLDYDLWPMYALGFTFLIASIPVQQYLTLELKRLGFTTSVTNALSIPGPALAVLIMMIPPIVSERLNHRTFVCATENLWSIPCYVALFLLPASASPWVYWAIATLQLGAPYVQPLQVAWIARNAGSVANRSVSAAVYNVAVQLGVIVGVNVYQPSDAPEYRRGNLAMALLCSGVLLQYIGVYLYYRWRNASKARLWDQMTREERVAYLDANKDAGNKSLAFRFAL